VALGGSILIESAEPMIQKNTTHPDLPAAVGLRQIKGKSGVRFLSMIRFDNWQITGRFARFPDRSLNFFERVHIRIYWNTKY
jgi:hypothetical protein